VAQGVSLKETLLSIMILMANLSLILMAMVVALYPKMRVKMSDRMLRQVVLWPPNAEKHAMKKPMRWKKIPMRMMKKKSRHIGDPLGKID